MSGKQGGPGPRKWEKPPRQVQPRHHDTYEPRAKPAQPIVCDGCSAVYDGGRWSWSGPRLTDVAGGLCPACQRIRDRYPAGTIRLAASFLEHRGEIERMVRNAEEAEREEHPLERLMDIEQGPDGGLVVTTTGIHLARAITSKLERRFHREARIRYLEEQNLLHVDFDA